VLDTPKKKEKAGIMKKIMENWFGLVRRERKGTQWGLTLFPVFLSPNFCLCLLSEKTEYSNILISLFIYFILNLFSLNGEINALRITTTLVSLVLRTFNCFCHCFRFVSVPACRPPVHGDDVFFCAQCSFVSSKSSSLCFNCQFIFRFRGFCSYLIFLYISVFLAQSLPLLNSQRKG